MVGSTWNIMQFFAGTFSFSAYVLGWHNGSSLTDYLELRIRDSILHNSTICTVLYSILMWSYILPEGSLGDEDIVTQSSTAVLYTDVTLHPPWWITRSCGNGDSILHSWTVYWWDLTSSLMDNLVLRIRWLNPQKLHCILRWPYILPDGLLGSENKVTQSSTAVLYTEETLPSWWITRSWGYGYSILHSCTV